MIVEILAIEECPNVGEAADRVRVALDRSGYRDVAVGIRRIRTDGDAAFTQFAGSPTITVDGVEQIVARLDVIA